MSCVHPLHQLGIARATSTASILRRWLLDLKPHAISISASRALGAFSRSNFYCTPHHALTPSRPNSTALTPCTLLPSQLLQLHCTHTMLHTMQSQHPVPTQLHSHHALSRPNFFNLRCRRTMPHTMHSHHHVPTPLHQHHALSSRPNFFNLQCRRTTSSPSTRWWAPTWTATAAARQPRRMTTCCRWACWRLWTPGALGGARGWGQRAGPA